jgi:hypothetical protein
MTSMMIYGIFNTEEEATKVLHEQYPGMMIIHTKDDKYIITSFEEFKKAIENEPLKETKLSKDEVLSKANKLLQELFIENDYNYHDYIVKIVLADTKEKSIKSALFYGNINLSQAELQETEREIVVKTVTDYEKFWGKEQATH